MYFLSFNHFVLKISFTRKYVSDSLNNQADNNQCLVQSLVQDQRIDMNEIVSLISDLFIGSFDTVS